MNREVPADVAGYRDELLPHLGSRGRGGDGLPDLQATQDSQRGKNEEDYGSDSGQQ